MPLRSGLDVDPLSIGWGYLYEYGANISIHLSTRMLMLYVELLKLGMIQFTVTKWKLLFLPTYYLHDNKQTFISNCVYTCMLSVIEMIPSPQRSISANHRTFLSSVA